MCVSPVRGSGKKTMNELTPEALYDAYRDKVLAYLTGRTDSREDADDLCHDVFEQVFRSLDTYDPSKASVSTWIYQITRFTLIDYIRTKHPGEPLSEGIQAADDTEEELIRRETLKRLAAALRSLDEDERDIVILRYYNGYSLTDISCMTGISYGMVKVKHKKALKKIGAKLR